MTPRVTHSDTAAVNTPDAHTATADTATTDTPAAHTSAANTSAANTSAVDTTAARRGTLYGLGAYVLWGAMPFYFLALAPAGAWEILLHRILWSLALCAVLLVVFGQARGLLRALRRPRRLAGVSIAGALIAVNWTVYLIAVTTGHVTEAALGYFLNPLVSVALGLVVLRESIRFGQAMAVTIGGLGGVYLAIDAGAVPWIALGLAFSFGTYGLVKKRLGVQLTALQSLTAETAVLAPIAGTALVWMIVTGQATFASYGPSHALLLASTGIITTVPLLLFAAAARRVALVTIGLLQFIAPILQFIAGLLLGEAMSTGRWTGFAIVWAALVVLVIDTLRNSRRQSRRRRMAARL